MIVYEDKSRFGKPIIIDYNQYNLGKQYKVKIGDDIKSMVFFDTYWQAMAYVINVKKGGMQ